MLQSVAAKRKLQQKHTYIPLQSILARRKSLVLCQKFALLKLQYIMYVILLIKETKSTTQNRQRTDTSNQNREQTRQNNRNREQTRQTQRKAVAERERERQTDRETERQRDRQRQRQTEIQRERRGQTDTDRETALTKNESHNDVPKESTVSVSLCE